MNLVTKSPAIQRADLSALIRAESAKLRRSGEDFADEVTRKRQTTPPVNRRGGHWNPTFDLSDARFTNPGYIEFLGDGWQLVVSIQGTVPGAVLDFDFDGGGEQLQCEPGAVLKGFFQGVRIKRNANSVQTGQVRLRVQTQPDVEYGELAKAGLQGTLGNPGGAGVGPAGATTQLYNSAAGNIPTAATDGVSLAGVRGVRAIVKANAASTITVAVGLLAWWQFSTVDNAWGETDMSDSPLGNGVARNIWVPNDKEVWVPEGRIYAEARSMTNSGGAGAFTVRLQTWG